LQAAVVGNAVVPAAKEQALREITAVLRTAPVAGVVATVTQHPAGGDAEAGGRQQQATAKKPG